MYIWFILLNYFQIIHSHMLISRANNFPWLAEFSAISQNFGKCCKFDPTLQNQQNLA